SPSNRSQYHPAICHMSGNEQSSDTKKSAVYFCRHAESRHNAFGDNSVDVDLSERGESQARALTGEFDLVLCSPMRRARRTLDLSGIRYQRLEIVPQMREWIFDLSDQMAGSRPNFGSRLSTSSGAVRWFESGSARCCQSMVLALKTRRRAASCWCRTPPSGESCSECAAATGRSATSPMPSSTRSTWTSARLPANIQIFKKLQALA
ncbi:hypothetical protein BOX15_Mlig014642g1, partial [Macrostomum lignano]